jgi:predicted Ser/Thr protein kinase
VPESTVHHRVLFQAHPPASTFVSGAAAEESTEFVVEQSSAHHEVLLTTFPNLEDLKVLGSGGMGVVYRARQRPLDRLVALKVLSVKYGQDTKAVVRLKSEAAAMAQLRHPGITQIYEYGDYNSSPYLLLEYVEGGTLADLVRQGPLRPRHAATLVESVARAVQHAHDRAIIHRDLKPSNILLTREGQPKVTDFGVAKLLKFDLRLTHQNQFMGTPQYSAPEQLHSAGTLTTQVDVYSLGVILYECLTGHPPHEGKTAAEMICQIIQTEPTPPRKVRREIPRDLETICLKCLQKDPEKRYHSAEALADDLQRFLAGEPISARAVTVTERAWKWCRRHPLSAALIAWIVVLVSVSVWVSFHFAFWAISESERASQAEAVVSIERNRAVIARQRAESQNQITQKTSRFLLENLLGRIVQAGQEATHDSPAIRQALDQASSRLAAEIQDEPLVEASIRQILGESYLHIKANDQAVGQLERALRLRLAAASKGPPHEAFQGVGALYQAYFRRSQFMELSALGLRQLWMLYTAPNP